MPRTKRRETPNREFGDFIKRTAAARGFDMEHGGTGRKTLAEATGMSVTAIGRILNGEALPLPANFHNLARVFDMDVGDLFAAAGLASDTHRPNGANDAVRSVTIPVQPDTAADLLGVTHPMVRPMLIANMKQAISLQEAFDHGGTNAGRAAKEG